MKISVMALMRRDHLWDRMKTIHDTHDAVALAHLKLIQERYKDPEYRKDCSDSDSDDEDFWKHGDMQIELAQNIV